MKRGHWAAIGAAAGVAAVAHVLWHYRLPSQTLFAREQARAGAGAGVAREGAIGHLAEDFRGYGAYSAVIDELESAAGLEGNAVRLAVASDHRGGRQAVRFLAAGGETRLGRPASLDLARWQSNGVVTAWLRLEDDAQVQRVDVCLRDAGGREAVLAGIRLPAESWERNRPGVDDDFPDLYFRGVVGHRRWEDYLLAPGWNLLYWEIAAPLPINMGQVAAWELRVQRGAGVARAFVVDSLRVQDGIAGDGNALGGQWQAPGGLPQYGVFQVEAPGCVRLLAVDERQCPSAGGRARLVTRAGTPRNFLLRARLEVERLPRRARWADSGWLRAFRRAAGADERARTYLRILWDCDHTADPGHDWSALYNGLEYEYLGLMRLFPVAAGIQQDTEPDPHAGDGRVRFAVARGHTYEFQLKVVGQRAEAEVYRVSGPLLKREARVAYRFRKPRPAASHPLALETAGALTVDVHAFEVLALP